MVEKTCFLFPGQGAQFPGMALDLYNDSDEVMQVFAKAGGVTGRDAETLLFRSTDEELKKTENTQLAMTIASLAASAYLKSRGIRPSGTAGFSLGEYAAYAEAGILSQEEVFRLVDERGRIMAATAGETPEACGMAAVVGMDIKRVFAVLEKASVEGVFPANVNSPVQIVLSGTVSGLEAVEPLLKEAGARRVIRLKVSGPFHSPLMQSAAEQMNAVIDGLDFQSPRIRFYSNVSGKAENDPVRIKDLCKRHIVSPVQWVASEASMVADGYDRYLETGAGKVLSGLWSKSGLTGTCHPGGTVEAIKKAINKEGTHAKG